MIVIGIDPGKSGGIVSRNRQFVCSADKMPATERDVVNILRPLSATKEVHCFLERVGAMPGQGVTSMFSFGQGYGFLRGCLYCLKIPFEEVTPQKWQREFGLLRTNKDETNTAKKNRHKARAQQLFPDENVTHSIADALLIAEYGLRVMAARSHHSAE